nr:unnamed protein product [Spirometra erinaceieuropaei]
MQTQRCKLPDAVHPSILDVLRRGHCQHKDCFVDNDAAISNFFVHKNRLHRTYLRRPTHANKAAFVLCHHLLHQRLQEILDAHKTEKDQVYADRNETKNFFRAIKTIYDKRNHAAYHLSWIKVSNRKIAHSEVLRPAIKKLPQLSLHNLPPRHRPTPPKCKSDSTWISRPPSLPETICPLQQLSGGKAPGSDVSPNQIYRHRGQPLTHHFQQM